MSRRASQCACAAVCLILTGCGAGDSTPASQTHADAPIHSSITHPVSAAASDAKRAQLGLLPRVEIPAEVIGQTQQRNKARCGPRVLFKHVATAMATTPRFAIDSGKVQQTVLLFRSANAADRAFDLLSSAGIQRCLERYVASTAREQTQDAVGEVREVILNLEPQGQRSAAYRMIVTGGTGFLVAVDVLLNRIGRGISSVSVIWELVPADIDFQELLTARIAARLRRTLA